LSENNQPERKGTCAACRTPTVTYTFEWTTKPACLVLTTWDGVTAVPPRHIQLQGTPYHLYGVIARQNSEGVSTGHYVSWIIADSLAPDSSAHCWFYDCLGIREQPSVRAKRVLWPPPNLNRACVAIVFYLRQPW
jgi:hypothetical protein